MGSVGRDIQTCASIFVSNLSSTINLNNINRDFNLSSNKNGFHKVSYLCIFICCINLCSSPSWSLSSNWIKIIKNRTDVWEYRKTPPADWVTPGKVLAEKMKEYEKKTAAETDNTEQS